MNSQDQRAVAQEAERLGFDSVWAAEAYGSDAATVLAWLAAVTSRVMQRYGFEQAANEIQDLYLDGKATAAADAIPTELIDMVSLCGPGDRVRERLAAHRDAGVSTLVSPMAFTVDDRRAQLRSLAELAS
jgi:alkanesulfonate monooxygenase SsuD/methylene tetrahydromethanopterin reductase-like flavin-dependent oxidoreductase (luciferase family)